MEVSFLVVESLPVVVESCIQMEGVGWDRIGWGESCTTWVVQLTLEYKVFYPDPPLLGPVLEEETFHARSRLWWSVAWVDTCPGPWVLIAARSAPA